MPEARANPWQYSEQEAGPVIQDPDEVYTLLYSANTASSVTAGTYLERFVPFERILDINTSQARENEMASPTREEFDAKLETVDAKLETVEARTEKRFVELSGKIDRLSDAVTTLASNVKAELADTRATVRDQNVFTRWTVVIAVVTSLIGAVSALWVTQGNLLSAFTAGLTLRTETKEAPSSQGQPKNR